MKVPLLDLHPPLKDLRDEIVEAVTRVIDSTQYIMGPEIDELEKEIAEYCGTEDAVGVSSGTDALLISLMVLDVGPGDIVLTTNFSFFATAGVVARLNATPVFVDIDPETFNIDPEQLRFILAEMDEQRRKRVKALIPVHLYGQCANMAEILKIAETLYKDSNLEFYIAGKPDFGNKSSINEKEYRDLKNSPYIKYLGQIDVYKDLYKYDI